MTSGKEKGYRYASSISTDSPFSFVHDLAWNSHFFWVERIEFKSQQSRSFKITATAYYLPEISTHEDYRCYNLLPILVLLLMFSN